MQTSHNPQILASLLHIEGTRKILEAFSSRGAEIRFVGGAVRDAALQLPTSDIDLATPLLPEESISLLQQQGFTVVPIGIKHGTIAVYLQGKSFEITTLRSDTSCDGRRATVAFTDDWQVDAARRDFTINALSCSPDGTIYDYFQGVHDLEQGIVRFVGDPYARIQEDFLRILRFFRFSAYYAKGLDQAAFEACSYYAPSLLKLSGERIQGEMIKILLSPNPLPILTSMQEHKILAVIMPESIDFQPLFRLVMLEKEQAMERNALRRLALLLRNNGSKDKEHALLMMCNQWKLSNKQKNTLKSLVLEDDFSVVAGVPEQQKALRRWGTALFRDKVLIAAAEQEVGQDALSAMLNLGERWEPPLFPVTGHDLQIMGMAKGVKIGALLKKIEQRWEESGYSDSKEILLNYARERYEE